ncbi:DUF938 domain-containing protein [Haliangium ochraceum]|uniref:SAM-dependent methyltransferase n=1 Tax=Haliangium ochraceum (strain DSM 14365 / JCM 11303 / SMP-2) TaxID=502025 RepID=D0LN78_HALO1|nr:DUF938 domain-containing protein [Haliangium ochraceum]ACY15255.1 protein of unknown function DUF938 [Haliangium ochraceum DSM 14365]
MKLSSPAAQRNCAPLAEVLADLLPPSGRVLEIASGSGQHAAYLARRFPDLVWQPSDIDPQALISIEAWRADSGEGEGQALSNLAPPIELDATAETWPVDRADVVLNLNMIHISPWSACLGLLRGAGALLASGGALILYGPYRVPGEPFAASNAAFDRSLRARNPAWGVRPLDAVEEAARAHGLVLEQRRDMPANNLTLLFRRS